MKVARSEATTVVDAANKQAADLLSGVRREAMEKSQKAETVVDAANKQAADLLSGVRREAKEKSQKAESALTMAIAEAAEIAAWAEKRAGEIAGKAYDALKRKEFYESTAQAMHNVVKGYGDRYMVAGQSVLDELAQQYGFVDAGEKLRLARERVRLMEKNRTAAACDYAEAFRREFAINFILDAFNGKFEAILARVRHDNYGTLRQEVADAFQLVNFNGKAFKDARITDEFLDARLNELKWAEAIHQVKLREREEQRAIREQIKEEEKARKEFERVIKQAQHDEDLLNKALEKARKEYAGASAEERAKYELKLQDLAEKLRAAEERNRRAISMAQQTRCGHVYVISNVGSFGEDVYKIGLTRRLEPLDRVRELGDASVPFAFDVHAMIYSDDAPALETALHKRFLQHQVNKVNRRKEFFRVDLEEIQKVAEEMNYGVKWTLMAEARDYRETMALQQKMEEDPALRDQWTQDQMNRLPRLLFDEEDEATQDDEVLISANGVE